MLLDAKARQVQSDVQRSQPPSKEYSPAMTAYHTFLTTGNTPDEDHDVAFSTPKNDIKREITEALLFGDADPEDVHNIFGVTPQALAVYEELFFDRKVFRNKLDYLAYLTSYPNKMGKELKMRAMNLGPEFIYYTYGNVVPKSVKQRQLVQRMFMAAAYKAMAINYNSSDSKITKNAVDHAKLMLKAWEALQKFGEEEVGEEYDLLKIILRKDPTKDPMVKETDII